MAKEIVVPDIGDFDSVEVIEVLVEAGDTIAAEDSLISVESDKATMEIPAPEAGVVVEVKVAIGDQVSQGSLVLLLEPSNEAPAAEAPVEKEAAPTPVASKPTPVAAPQPIVQPQQNRPSPTAKIDEVSFARAYASPSVRKFARELGVDLGRVAGSGRKGRIVKEDVKAFVKQALTQGMAGSPVSFCIVTGSRFRMSPSLIRPISPSWMRCAKPWRQSTKTKVLKLRCWPF
jgi:pyruvate dehydrogenase E2 component (dihydrolipoamide acetyltransferase)